MIVTTSRAPPPRRAMGGFGFVWLEAIASLFGGGAKGGAVPAVQPVTVPVGGGSDTGLYIALGVGAIAIAGLAVTILRAPAPAPRPVAVYRRRSRS